MPQNIVCLFVLLISTFFINASTAQNNIKYGDVTADQFRIKNYSVDSNAAAVYLFDIGSCYYEGNSFNNLRLVYTRHARIHLLNKNSFGLATVEIPLYQDGTYREEIESLKATTFNIQNGKIEEINIE